MAGVVTSAKSDATDLEHLISRVALADRGAFDRLYQLTTPRLLGVAMRIVGDRVDAEDVVQEAFLKIWRRAGLYVPSSAGDPIYWLVAIVRNTAIDLRRRRRDAAPAKFDEPVDASPTPEARALMASEHHRLTECLDQLPPDRATLLRKAYFGGQTYAELSIAEKTPLGTVKSWMRRSLARLRDCIEAEPRAKS